MTLIQETQNATMVHQLESREDQVINAVLARGYFTGLCAQPAVPSPGGWSLRGHTWTWGARMRIMWDVRPVGPFSLHCLFSLAVNNLSMLTVLSFTILGWTVPADRVIFSCPRTWHGAKWHILKLWASQLSMVWALTARNRKVEEIE